MVQSSVLGFPRMGRLRDLKKATEAYWGGKLSADELLAEGKRLRLEHWKIQKDAGVDIIPSGDFAYYDQVLDHIQMFGAVPDRYSKHGISALEDADEDDDDIYSSISRQKGSTILQEEEDEDGFYTGSVRRPELLQSQRSKAPLTSRGKPPQQAEVAASEIPGLDVSGRIGPAPRLVPFLAARKLRHQRPRAL